MIKVISFRNDKKKEYAKFVLDTELKQVCIYNHEKDIIFKCEFDDILDIAKLIDKRFKPF